jgi:hypothetical protein
MDRHELLAHNGMLLRNSSSVDLGDVLGLPRRF